MLTYQSGWDRVIANPRERTWNNRHAKIRETTCILKSRGQYFFLRKKQQPPEHACLYLDVANSGQLTRYRKSKETSVEVEPDFCLSGKTNLRSWNL